MSSIRIGLAVIGSVVALTASASAEVRYAGSPKFGHIVNSPPAAQSAGKSGVFDARAELPVPPAPVRKGGIGARGL